MRKLLTFTLLSISLSAFSSQASTLITLENLDRLQALYTALHALDEQFQNEEQADVFLELEPHCDWQKHYQSQHKVIPQAQLQQSEALFKQHGFRSGAEYFELSMKVMSPGFAAMETYLKEHNITPDANSLIGESMLRNQQLNNVISACLSSADKAALKRYEAKILEILEQSMQDDDDRRDFDQQSDAIQY